jgi:hypothetical protein
LIKKLQDQDKKVVDDIKKTEVKDAADKEKELNGAKADWLCKNDKTKFCRKLTDDEAKCYWINQPGSAKDYSADGEGLNTENASFSWNFEANSNESVEGNVACKQFPSTMKGAKK